MLSSLNHLPRTHSTRAQVFSAGALAHRQDPRAASVQAHRAARDRERPLVRSCALRGVARPRAPRLTSSPPPHPPPSPGSWAPTTTATTTCPFRSRSRRCVAQPLRPRPLRRAPCRRPWAPQLQRRCSRRTRPPRTSPRRWKRSTSRRWCALQRPCPPPLLPPPPLLLLLPESTCRQSLPLPSVSPASPSSPESIAAVVREREPSRGASPLGLGGDHVPLRLPPLWRLTRPRSMGGCCQQKQGRAAGVTSVLTCIIAHSFPS